jgi:hypothetical protein
MGDLIIHSAREIQGTIPSQDGERAAGRGGGAHMGTRSMAPGGGSIEKPAGGRRSRRQMRAGGDAAGHAGTVEMVLRGSHAECRGSLPDAQGYLCHLSPTQQASWGPTGQDQGHHVPAGDGHGGDELHGEGGRRGEVDGVEGDGRQREDAARIAGFDPVCHVAATK